MLAYVGVGHNAFIKMIAPDLGIALTIAGRWVFGWALARVFVAMLLGRLRAVHGVLTLRVLVPVATLSYSAYLLQNVPMLLLPTWSAAGASTPYAAWAVWLLGFLLASVLSLAMALPQYVAIERPFRCFVQAGAHLECAE